MIFFYLRLAPPEQLLRPAKVFFIGIQKQDDGQRRGEVVRGGLGGGEHGGRVEQAAKRQQDRDIEQALPADGEDQGGDRRAGGLDGVDKYKQQSHDRAGVYVDAGECDAVSGGVRVV